MKRNILDVMSSENSRMSPKFRASLRSSLLAAENRNTKQQSKYFWTSKLWLVPASGLAAAFLLVAFGLNISKPVIKNGPFKPELVSAAQLIQNSDNATKSGIGDNTYFRFAQTIHFGSAAKSCDVGSYLGDTDSSYIHSGYRDPSGKVEAGYVEAKGSNGAVKYSSSMYDDTNKQLYDGKEFFDTSIYKSLANYFAGRDVSDNVMYYLSDQEGNRISDSLAIKATDVNGVSAYTVYAVSNPASQDVQVRCWPKNSNRDPKSANGTYVPPTYKPTIRQLILDAHNYSLIRETAYLSKVSPSNLLRVDDRTVNFQNLSADKALRLMEKDGFDKSKASNSLQGKD